MPEGVPDLVVACHPTGRRQQRRLFGKNDSFDFTDAVFRQVPTNLGKKVSISRRTTSRAVIPWDSDQGHSHQRYDSFTEAAMEKTSKSTTPNMFQSSGVYSLIDDSRLWQTESPRSATYRATTPSTKSEVATSRSPFQRTPKEAFPQSRGRKFWQHLALPRSVRVGLSTAEKEIVSSSRCAWMLRQNDLRYMGGEIDDGSRYNDIYNGFRL